MNKKHKQVWPIHHAYSGMNIGKLLFQAVYSLEFWMYQFPNEEFTKKNQAEIIHTLFWDQ